MKTITFIIILSLISFFNKGYSQDSTYINGELIFSIDFSKEDSYSLNIDKFKKNNFITILILKANSTFGDTSDPPKPINIKTHFNENIVKVIIYQPINSKRKDSFRFHLFNSKSEEIAEINPYVPKLLLITTNKEWIKSMKESVNLDYYKDDAYILTLPKILIEQSVVEEYLNKILSNSLNIKQIDVAKTYIDTTKIYEKIKILSDRIDSIKANMPIIKKDIPVTQKENYFETHYSLPFYNLNGFDNSEINSKIKSNYSFSFKYTFFPSIENKWIGAGIEMNIAQTDITLSSIDKITDISNSLSFNQYNEGFYRVTYSKGIVENISIQSISILPYLSFKLIDLTSSNKWVLSFNPGVKISKINSAYYTSNISSISYGSMYHQYSNDTIFTGKFDNLSHSNVSFKNQPLQINNTMVSLYLPINIQREIFNNLYLSLGAYYDFGLTNILNNYLQDKMISNNIGNYNSLLYRQNNIKISSFGFNFGLSIKF